MTAQHTGEHTGKSRKKLIIGVLTAVAVVVMIPVLLVATVLFVVVGGGTAAQGDCVTTDGAGTVAGITGADSGPGVPKKLKEEQLKNAKTIDETAKKLGLSGKASRIAIITAYGESTLMNLNYGDEAHGVKNADGSATTSKGLFQQQTSMGWGTVEQVTNPEYAATSFLLGPKHNGVGGLVSVPGWESGEPTQVIHTVQGNADPNHYAAYYGPADAIIREAGIDVSRGADESKQGNWKPQAVAGSASKAANQTVGEGCAAVKNGGAKAGQAGKSGNGKNSYPWDAPAPGIYTVDTMGFFFGECTSYASWKVNEAMGGSKDKIIFNNSFGGHQKGNAATWKAAWEASGWEVSKTPKAGSVAWWPAYGGDGIGSAGHVGWVDEVKPDGKVVISEYNNSYYGPPGHKYSVRPEPIDPSKVGGYLYVPGK